MVAVNLVTVILNNTCLVETEWVHSNSLESIFCKMRPVEIAALDQFGGISYA